MNQTLSANSAGVTVIWASPDFGHPHSQNPSDVNASPLIITLAIWVKVRARVTGNAFITRGLRMGMPKRVTRARCYMCVNDWCRHEK